MTIVQTQLMQRMPQAAMMCLNKTEPCPLCKVGHLPFKLKRRTVHHFPETGQLIVCKAAELRSNQI